MNIRVLIADDEPPARARVRAMLSAHEHCEVSGEAADGAEAADMILRDCPDLVFLDIKMPELDGFEVLDALRIGEGPTPAIVFVTAFDQFALKAFEVGALDYLLKPFDQSRFDRAFRAASDKIAVRRLRMTEGAAAEGVDAELETFLQSTGPRREFPSRFLVRRGRQMQFIRAETIDWLDAQANYVQLHIGGRTHLLRDTMTAMETKLDPSVFVRVHRSVIVNIDRVATIEPHVHGEFEITMRDGSRMTTSAAHSAKLRGMLR
ncbi:MAG: LytTR family DNA-binding domain-containing protein [bacterium]